MATVFFSNEVFRWGSGYGAHHRSVLALEEQPIVPNHCCDLLKLAPAAGHPMRDWQCVAQIGPLWFLTQSS